MSTASFSKNVPDLEFTGERFIPGHGDVQIHMEHFQRYVAAAALVDDRSRVVDYGCGVGYGAHFLAQKARRVLAVDIAEDTIHAARRSYQHEGLEFRTISSAQIPVSDHSVDVVTCFEVVEHTSDQIRLIGEFERILKPDGLCIISSPERRAYSERTGYNNPFHVAELTFEELDELLARRFPVRLYYRQRFAAVSMFVRRGFEQGAPARESVLQFQRRGDAIAWSGPDAEGASALYYVAICTTTLLPDVALRLDQILVDENNAFASELCAATAAAQGRVASLEQEIRAAREYQAKLESQLERLPTIESEIEQARTRQAESEALAERISGLEKERDQALAARTALEDELKRERAHQAEIEALAERIPGLEKERDQALAARTALEDELKREREQLETELEAARTRQAEVEARLHRIPVLEADIDQARRRQADIETQFAEKDAQIQDTEATLATIYGSKAWRALSVWRKVKYGLVLRALRPLGRLLYLGNTKRIERAEAPGAALPANNPQTASPRAALAQTHAKDEVILEGDHPTLPVVRDVLNEYRDRPGVTTMLDEANGAADTEPRSGEVRAEPPGSDAQLDQRPVVQSERSHTSAFAPDLGRSRRAQATQSAASPCDFDGARQPATLLKAPMSKPDRDERDLMILKGQLRESEDKLAAQVKANERASQLIRQLEASLALIEGSGSYRMARLLSRFLPATAKSLYRKLSRRRVSVGRQQTAQMSNTERSIQSFTFSIVVPVYNHADYLEPMLKSLLAQTSPAHEVILVDDASPDPRVRTILNRYSTQPNIRLIFNERNRGISETLNAGIMAATGSYIAFVDCDDLLPKHALEQVERYLTDNPAVDFVYSNRIDIDERDQPVQHWDFTNRATVPCHDALMVGMFTSHLKVVRRTCFFDVGLFKTRYDLSQDYDFSLRMAEKYRFGHLPQYLYEHRVHPRQQTQRHAGQQTEMTAQIQADSRRRQLLRRGDPTRKVSIIMLTLNRPEITRRAIEHLLALQLGSFELIVFDNGSSEPTLLMLRKYAAHPKVTLITSSENHGVSGGRRRAAQRASGDYLFFLDSDILVEDSDVLIKLIERLEEDPQAAGCCCKVVFPNGRIQFNGGLLNRSGGCFVRFHFIDVNKDCNDATTLVRWDCDWIPGGATMWRRTWFERFPPHPDALGAFEDNEVCLRIRKAGGTLLNCPTAVVVHHHHTFEAKSDEQYLAARYDRKRILSSLRLIYCQHGVVVDDMELYKMIGLPIDDREHLLRYFRSERQDGTQDRCAVGGHDARGRRVRKR